MSQQARKTIKRSAAAFCSASQPAPAKRSNDPQNQSASPLDCPVCLDGFSSTERQPLVLPCGHSLCSACCRKLPPQAHCPVCRLAVKTKDVPVSYTILQMLSAEGKRTRSCDECLKLLELSEAWLCRQEGCQMDSPDGKFAKLLCSFCSFRRHRDHTVDLYPEALEAVKQRQQDGIAELYALVQRIAYGPADMIHERDAIVATAKAVGYPNLDPQLRETIADHLLESTPIHTGFQKLQTAAVVKQGEWKAAEVDPACMETPDDREIKDIKQELTTLMRRSEAMLDHLRQLHKTLDAFAAFRRELETTLTRFKPTPE